VSSVQLTMAQTFGSTWLLETLN